MASLVSRVLLALLVLLVNKVPLEHLVLQVPGVPLALLVLLAKMDSTVSLAPSVPLVLEVALVTAVLLYVAPHPLPHDSSPRRLEYL